MGAEKSVPRAVLEHAIEKWNGGDLNGCLELYHENAVVHHVPDRFAPGITGIREFYQALWESFSSEIRIHDLFSEEDKLAIRYTFHAKKRESGEESTTHCITTLHFRDGKCVERWDADETHLR
ncbi:MAG: nuclear transport factor 2 family protein [Candidatus Methylomirabilales bacterium]